MASPKQPPLENRAIEKHIRYALIILSGIFVLLLIFLFWQYESLRREQLLDSRHLRSAAFLQHHAPLPVSDAAIMKSWMTFDYINKLFALPASYLRDELQIANSHYPHLTIADYAKSQSLNAAVFLNEVEQAVERYRASSSSSSLSSSSQMQATSTVR
jgi:hypothetical protein